jgi:hypothetical protein
MSAHQLNDTTLLRGPVALLRMMLRQFIHCGDTAVDATCGNGNDTLLLAELVGAYGTVWAFDIQSRAIDQTTGKLSQAGCLERVKLIRSGHENMAQIVTGKVNGVVFNLGYLPGADKSVITRSETTLPALEQSLGMLATGGILAVTLYPGHDGGKSEQRDVDAWLSSCDQRIYQVWRMAQMNTAPSAPYLILIQKAA